MENLGLPELTTEQIETLCSITEDAAREYIFLKVPSKTVEKLSISVEAEGEKPLNLTVDVDIVLLNKIYDETVEEIVNQAVKQALKAGEEYLRKLK